MNLNAATDERNGVTLVELQVENPTRTTRRVRIQNELNGSVLPPRRHGSSVEGFDEDGLTLTIAAGARRAVGYACRAGAESPPATLVGSEPCESTELEERSPDDVLAALGDPRPPVDAVTPELCPPKARPAEAERKVRADPAGNARIDDCTVSSSTQSPRDTASRTASSTTAMADHSTATADTPEESDAEGQTDSDHSETVPPVLEAWLTRASDRIEGGDPVDAASLRAVADRADSLARRAGR